MPPSDQSTAASGASDVPVDLRTVVFAPIAGEGLVQQAIRRLTDAINIGLLTAGERLPSETQLSGWLGISTMTLREALATLRNAGYIETRRGRSGGNFVTEGPRPATEVAATTPAGVELQYLCDLTDYRRAIAGEAAALAAERATPSDLEALARHLDETVNATTYLDYLRCDAQFHISVAGASGSTRLWKEQTTVEMELNGVALLSPARLNPQQVRALLKYHRALLDAIRERDAERAREIAEAYVNRAGDAVIALVFDDGTRTRSS